MMFFLGSVMVIGTLAVFALSGGGLETCETLQVRLLMSLIKLHVMM